MMTIQRDQAGLEGLLDLEDLIGLALPAGLGDRNLPGDLGWADRTRPVQGLKGRARARYGFSFG